MHTFTTQLHTTYCISTYYLLQISLLLTPHLHTTYYISTYSLLLNSILLTTHLLPRKNNNYSSKDNQKSKNYQKARGVFRMFPLSLP